MVGGVVLCGGFLWALEFVICLNFFVFHFWLGEYTWKVGFPSGSRRGRSFLLKRVPLGCKCFISASIGDDSV